MVCNQRAARQTLTNQFVGEEERETIEQQFEEDAEIWQDIKAQFARERLGLRLKVKILGEVNKAVEKESKSLVRKDYEMIYEIDDIESKEKIIRKKYMKMEDSLEKEVRNI